MMKPSVADAVDILVHDLLHDSRLSRVVQTPNAVSLNTREHAFGARTASGCASPCPSNAPFAILTTSCIVWFPGPGLVLGRDVW
jgi:hypothetical protein